MEAGWGLRICHMSADYFVLKEKIIFVDGGSVGHKIGGHKYMILRWFKITTNSIIRIISFFFNIMPQARF